MENCINNVELGAKENLNNELLDIEVWQICDRTGWLRVLFL